MTFKKRLTLVAVIVGIMFLLHNSFWLWPLDARAPVLFGFLPFAFYYYLFYTLVAVGALKLITKLAWPDPPPDLFTVEQEEEESR